MNKLMRSLSILLFFIICQYKGFGQAFDEKLIIGKWKFVKTTQGYSEKDYTYNGDPLLTFAANGQWVTEDSNPNYRQKGTWKIAGKNLVRDPDKTEKRDVPPYSREIKILTQNELVFSVVNDGLTFLTFYFSKIE